MAHDHHDFISPVDLRGRPIAGGKPLRWATVTIVVASLFLLFTNAISITAWLEELPSGPLQAQFVDIARSWQKQTEGWGLATPRAALHREWKAAQAVRFEQDQR